MGHFSNGKWYYNRKYKILDNYWNVLSMKEGCIPSKPFIRVRDVSDYINPTSDVKLNFG